MAETVSWDRIAAVLADPDVGSPTKAALLAAYGIAVPDASRLHPDAYAGFATVDPLIPAGAPPQSATTGPGRAATDLLPPELAGLGIATGAGVEVGRWTDTTDILTQAAMETGSVAKLDGWERKVDSGPTGVDTADELLAAGAGGLVFFRLFLPACTRLAKPPLPPAKLADYLDLYQAENGLEFAAFTADAQFLQTVAAQLRDTVADVTAAQDTLQSWGGDAGPAARRHLGTVADRVEQLADNMADGDAPNALSGLILKAVGTLQHAVLQKAQTVAGLKSSTVFRAPALTASELDCLIDALEPDAADDVLLDAARVMRAEHLPLASLLNPAVRLAIRGAAETWTDAFLQWFAAVDRTFRMACSATATVVDEAMRTMAEGYRVQLPDHFFAGIPLVSVGAGEPGGTGGSTPGGPTLPGLPGGLDPQQLLAGRPVGSGWVDLDHPLPPGWYTNPVTGAIGPLFPPGGYPATGEPPVRPDWLPDGYGYLPAGSGLPDGWQLDAVTGELDAPPGYVGGAPAAVQIGDQTGTVRPSAAWPGGYEVSLKDAAGVLHSHRVSYDAYGHPVIGADLDGVSQLADLSTLDDIAGSTDSAGTSPAAGAGDMSSFGDVGGGVELPVPDLDAGVDIGTSAAAAGSGVGAGSSEAAATTVMPPPASWSPDPPATSLTSSDGASALPAAGPPITASGTTSGHPAASPMVPMMPMVPGGGEAARGGSRYAVPSGLVDEKELEEIDNLGPVIGGKE